MSIAVAIVLFVIAIAVVAILMSGDNSKPDYKDYGFIALNLTMGVMNIATGIRWLQIVTGAYLCALAVVACGLLLAALFDSARGRGPAMKWMPLLFLGAGILTCAGIFQLVFVA